MISLLAASTAYGSGFRIPEQSLNSSALANAYVAHTEAADAAYYNPANMNFLSNGWHTEASLMYINLPSIDYAAASGAPTSSTNSENFFMPQVFVVSPDYNKFRLGFAVTYPAGLTKRWENAPQNIFAEEFTLQTVEFNPTISYQFCNKFSAAAGVRLMYASGVVKNNAIVLTRDVEGDTVEFGYNLALTLRPTDQWSIGTTYRSKIDLGVEGDAVFTGIPYVGGVSVDLPIPAVLTIGTSYTFDKTTVELTYDRTYWSSYEQLDFNYDINLVSTFGAGLSPFENPIVKNWTDVDAFRIGLTHKFNDRLTTMIGFAIDDNPVPDDTLGYELPDSESKIYSIGFRYKVNEKLEVGAAYLLNVKDERTISLSAANAQGIDGKFSEGGAHLVNIGVSYSY